MPNLVDVMVIINLSSLVSIINFYNKIMQRFSISKVAQD